MTDFAFAARFRLQDAAIELGISNNVMNARERLVCFVLRAK